jgi:hypothetical protein
LDERECTMSLGPRMRDALACDADTRRWALALPPHDDDDDAPVPPPVERGREAPAPAPVDDDEALARCAARGPVTVTYLESPPLVLLPPPAAAAAGVPRAPAAATPALPPEPWRIVRLREETRRGVCQHKSARGGMCVGGRKTIFFLSTGGDPRRKGGGERGEGDRGAMCSHRKRSGMSSRLAPSNAFCRASCKSLSWKMGGKTGGEGEVRVSQHKKQKKNAEWMYKENELSPCLRRPRVE